MGNIGVDIIEIERVRAAVSRWGDAFLQRVYTKSEIAACEGRVSSLAARFAAKEAAIKVISCDGAGVFLRDIEILSGTGGRPQVRLHGKARELAARQNILGLAVSLSHSRQNAVAVALAVGQTASPA